MIKATNAPMRAPLPPLRRPLPTPPIPLPSLLLEPSLRRLMLPALVLAALTLAVTLAFMASTTAACQMAPSLSPWAGAQSLTGRGDGIVDPTKGN